MKVKLTEEQFKNIVKRELDEMICVLGEGITSKDIKNQQNLIMQKMQNAYKENKPLYNQDGSIVDDGNGEQLHFVDRMSDIGRHIGVTHNDNDMNDIQWKTPENQEQTKSTPQEDFGGYIYNLVKVAQVMRTNNVVNAGGAVGTDLYYPYDPKTNNNFQNVRDVDGYKGSFMMRCRNALDLLGLNWLYMPASVWEKNANKKTIGLAVEIMNDYDNKAKKVIPDEYEEHKNDIDYLFKRVDEIDSQGMCNLVYNKIFAFLTSEEQQKDWYGGTRVGKFKDKSAITTAFFKQQTDKMFEQVYGIHLDIPSETFTLGNHKLGNETLIINFASAHQCPAWNQCLVKNSCYAKSIENVRPLVYGKNKKMTMMWEASQYDNEILDALKTLIRLYVVNISQMRKYIKQPKNNVSYDYGQVAEAKSVGDDYCLSLIRAGFDKMSPEQLDIIKKTEKIKRANYVRLNEAGDFIGQWLVDAMDEFAGELKLIDVTVAAYTCRNLNYNGIKNIIINASLSTIGGNIARRFYAVPEDIYNSLDDTYAASIGDVQYDENGMPNTKKITHPIIVNGSVIPYPQPMYDENGNFMNAYYYKCPCGRGKEAMGNNSADTKYYFNNVEGTTEKGGVGCYQCNMCYQPKNPISDKPVNVYVQVHSVESDMFDFKQQKDFGTSKDYQQKRSIFKPNNKVNEGIEYDEDNQEQAIQQITNNAIQSVNEHLAGLAQQRLKEERIKKEFFDTLKKLM